jgi:hypothetical protein
MFESVSQETKDILGTLTNDLVKRGCAKDTADAIDKIVKALESVRVWEKVIFQIKYKCF